MLFPPRLTDISFVVNWCKFQRTFSYICYQRILDSVVQLSQIPVHVFALYLYPSAVIGSHKCSLNCKILSWVMLMADALQGPIVITGDMNIRWCPFDILRYLTPRGWSNMHELAHHRFGISSSPTFKGSTRHAFQFGSLDFSRLLRGMSVPYGFHLDSQMREIR